MDTDFLTRVDEHYAEMQRVLSERGFGERVGVGKRPAILVVDFIKGFTDPRSQLSSDLDSEVDNTAKILDVARKKSVPVILTTSYTEGGLWTSKMPSNALLVPGSEWIEIDDRLNQQEEDQLLVKVYASCFFGTDLSSRLVSRRVDTLIVTGCTTSGCVRASAIDSCSMGFRTVVVGDAVGDRAPVSHKASLFDLDAKYADVMSTQEVIQYLESIELPK